MTIGSRAPTVLTLLSRGRWAAMLGAGGTAALVAALLVGSANPAPAEVTGDAGGTTTTTS